MRKLFLSLILTLGLATIGFAQDESGIARRVRWASSAPATCSPSIGDIYWNTTSKRLFSCSAANTWTEVGTTPSTPILFPDGTASLPGISFASDSNTGIYRIGTDNFGFSAGGALIGDIGTGGLTMAASKTITAPATGHSIGFLQSGTGAVATTIQAKLGEEISVKDFGAVGDGSADDTAEIQAAIDALTATITSYANSALIPKYTLEFPAGDYKLSAALTISNSINLKGYAARLVQTSATANGLVFDGRTNALSDIKMEGISIERSTKETTTTYIGVWLRGSCQGFDLNIPRIVNFGRGLFLGDDTGVAASNAYHRIHIGYIAFCNQAITLWAGDNSGWCNDNFFYGGELSGTDADGTNSIGVLISGAAGNLGYPDSNQFFGLSIEKLCTINATSARAVKIHKGAYNKFWGLRLEQGAAELIEFSDSATYNSIELIFSGTNVDLNTLLVGDTLGTGYNEVYNQRGLARAKSYDTIRYKGRTDTLGGTSYVPGASLYTSEGKYPVFGVSPDASRKSYEMMRVYRNTYRGNPGSMFMSGGQIVTNGIIVSSRSGTPVGITGTMTTGSKTLTTGTSAHLLPGDRIIVKGAGAAGADLSTAVYTNTASQPTIFTLDDAAGTNVAGVAVIHAAMLGDFIFDKDNGYTYRLGWKCTTTSTTTVDAAWSPVGLLALSSTVVGTLNGISPVTAAANDIGTSALPYKDIYFAGTSGTPGTNNFKFTGASTGGLRTITLPDASVTVNAAANISGTTLASNVVASSLTSVGTLTSLAVGASGADSAGPISGLSRTVSYTTDQNPLAAQDLRGTVVDNTGAGATVAITLPAGAAGNSATFQIIAAQAMTIARGSTNTFVDLAAGTTGTLLTSGTTEGAFCRIYFKGTKWYVTGKVGTWTLSTP